MELLAAVDRLLGFVGEPLHYEDLSCRLINLALWEPRGEDPAGEVLEALSAEVLAGGEGALVVSLGRGYFQHRDVEAPAKELRRDRPSAQLEAVRSEPTRAETIPLPMVPMEPADREMRKVCGEDSELAEMFGERFCDQLEEVNRLERFREALADLIGAMGYRLRARSLWYRDGVLHGQVSLDRLGMFTAFVQAFADEERVDAQAYHRFIKELKLRSLSAGVLLTTGEITEEARVLASVSRMQLVLLDGDQLLELLLEEGMSWPLAPASSCEDCQRESGLG